MSSFVSVYFILFCGALFAGTMDTIAGGGGLITVPLLFSLKIEPLEVFGTNKFQSSFGSFSATINFFKEKKYNIKSLIGVFFTATGAYFGAFSLTLFNPIFLKKIVPFLLYSIAIFLFFYKQFGWEKGESKLSVFSFYLLFGLSIGFYDGFFGPGTGTFWAISFVKFLGMDLKEATINTKLMNFVSNVVSLMFFLSKNTVLFLPGVTMAIGQFLGGFIGAKIVLKKGVKIIKPLLLIVSIVLATKLLIENYF